MTVCVFLPGVAEPLGSRVPLAVTIFPRRSVTLLDSVCRLITESTSLELSVAAFGDHRALKEAAIDEMPDTPLRC